MRVLWLKSDLLLPLDTGGKLRTWHLLRQLARRHEITYLAFAEARTPRALVDGMAEVASHVETVARAARPKGSLRFYADAAAHMIDPLPYAVGAYRSRDYRRRLSALLARKRFDVLVCDFLVPAVNLPDALPCPAVLFTHNVESEIWRRHADTQTGGLRRMLFRAQHRKMRRFEARALGRFDGVLAVSDADRSAFGRLYPHAVARPIQVVSTGVDTGYFSPAVGAAETGADAPRSHELIFTGSMDWLPNEDAMLYFAREILPVLRAEDPRVHLSIVGRAPTPAVRALAGDGVTVTGSVDDVRPFMRDAAVYVVPLRIGGGTRLKIFEAMAMGKAVVSTVVGAEGLPVTNGEQLVLADGPAEFARSVLDLLHDRDRRGRLERAARALVLEHFDWSVVARELEDALVGFARAPSRNAELSQSSLAECVPE
jgi:sugar transferase (PEP-CTERM/EpsH1 system associated)